MKFTESQKQELRDFIAEATSRVAVYFKTTLGLPEEIFFQEFSKIPTLGEQMAFLSAFSKNHPKVFEGMKHYSQ